MKAIKTFNPYCGYNEIMRYTFTMLISQNAREFVRCILPVSGRWIVSCKLDAAGNLYKQYYYAKWIFSYKYVRAAFSNFKWEMFAIDGAVLLQNCPAVEVLYVPICNHNYVFTKLQEQVDWFNFQLRLLYEL